MTSDQKTALKHIIKNGDDRNLRAKRWLPIKRDLRRLGFLQRRIWDWALVPTEAAMKDKLK